MGHHNLILVKSYCTYRNKSSNNILRCYNYNRNPEKFISFENLNLAQEIRLNPDSVEWDTWVIMPRILRIPFALSLIDINPHTKFQVATIKDTLKSTFYKNRILTEFA